MLFAFTFFSSSRNDPTVWAVIGTCAGVYLFFRGFRLLQRKRLILDTPTSKIHSAAMGLVEVSGLAVGPYTMTAPVTGRACYYYRTVAWQLKQSGKNKEWEKVAEECLHLPFFLDDNTGRVLVNPQGAELDIHRDFHEEFSGSFFGSSPDVPANVASFLARHGVSNDKKLKIDEYCIKPKNALFILGTLAENPGVEVGPTPLETFSAGQFQLKGRVPGVLAGMLESALKPRAGVVTFTQQEVVTLSHSGSTNSADMTQQGKIAAALTKAGITNPAAWAAAGMPFPGVSVNRATPAGVAAAPAEAFDTRPPAVLMKGTHNPAFFISWHSQKDIVNSLGWKSVAMIWGGPALTLLSAYILASHFGWL